MIDFINVPGRPEASSGIYQIAAERLRQIEEKGYTLKHDSEYEQEELIAAGLCYIESALHQIQGVYGDYPPYNWPWDADQWNPSDGDTLKDLKRGAALIAAAIDWALNPE